MEVSVAERVPRSRDADARLGILARLILNSRLARDGRETEQGSRRAATMPQSFQTSISWLSFFWAALYALRQYQRRTHQGSFLPAPRSSAPSTSPDLYRSRQTRVTLRNFHLNVQSTTLNGFHQNATARLKRRDRWRALLTFAYDIGSVLGLLGMIGSVLLLGWTTVQLGLSWCSHPTQSNISPEYKSLHKRDAFTDDVPTMSQDSRSAPLYLIVSYRYEGTITLFNTRF